jgi:hypothetical protein
MTTTNNYSITIEVKDKDGKRIVDKDGEYQISINFDTHEMTDTQIQSILKSHFRTLNAWMPDHKIVVKASVFNSMTRTYPLIFSYSDNGLQSY